MKIYLDEDVFTAAQKRIARVFDEFENVVVDVSGGKDSTVVFNLAMLEAEKRGRLPLPVYFLDQEAEWDVVIDQIRLIMYDPRVKPYWMQVPFKLTNSTSYKDGWLMCWRPGDTWIREKDPISIKENLMGCDRFKELFGGFMAYYYKDKPCAMIGGVRAEESPARSLAVTSSFTYKDIAWGKKTDPKNNHYSFYPIYDWSYTDVWKAIHDNKWPYCKLYDLMYQHGIGVLNMRVSNVNHETALVALTFMQELEPNTWDRITMRLSSTNAVKTDFGLYSCPSKLPYMFSTWQEYRDHLLENLIEDEDIRQKMRRTFKTTDDYYAGIPNLLEGLWKTGVTCVLINDYEFVKLNGFRVSANIRRGKKKIGIEAKNG